MLATSIYSTVLKIQSKKNLYFVRNFNLLCAALYKIKKNALFNVRKFKKNVYVHIPHIEFPTLINTFSVTRPFCIIYFIIIKNKFFSLRLPNSLGSFFISNTI